MSEAIEYDARSARFYKLDGHLIGSIVMQSGEHVRIKFGIAQVESMAVEAPPFVIEYHKQRVKQD